MKKMKYVLVVLMTLSLIFSACSDDADSGGQTFTATDTPMDVPGDGSYTNSYITVSGGPTSISKMTVRVEVPHSNTGALDISLFGPNYTSGTNGAIILALNEGPLGVGTQGGYVNVVFDDTASQSIVGATMPVGGFTGSYRPEWSFSPFIGTTANGQWRLRVYEDLAHAVHGEISSWSITFE